MSLIPEGFHQFCDNAWYLPLAFPFAGIHENAELLTEEGDLLQSVQGEDYDIDQYASRLGEILERKTVLIESLQGRLGSFKDLLRKEEELSRLR